MRFLRYIIILSFVFALSCRKSDYVLEDPNETITDNGFGTGTVTWTKDKSYVLEGFVFVNDGQVLTIEAGTVIRFRAGQAENASALIVARGGKIIAEGTPDQPIIFTSEDDDLQGSVATEERGLWGGLIILGNAPINIDGGEGSIEGIPLAEPRGIYGGTNENDNSGLLKYISIRHGGTNIGEGNEINGLTLGGVGNETQIDYVEVISNEDDGVEIFGGTVNLKHMVVSGCGDDLFDYDLGWSGNGQFWLGAQLNLPGDNLIEAGGGTNPVYGIPNSLPNLFNLTLFGSGNSSNGLCATFEKNAGGVVANSIFMNKDKGIALEVTDQEHDSYNQWKKGKLDIQNNVFYQVANSTPESIFKLNGIYTPEMANEWVASFNTSKNEIRDPAIDPESGSFVPNEKVKGEIFDYPLPWFQIVDFKGAFGEDDWIQGWTLLASQ